MLNVVLILIILFVKMNFILVNVSIEKAILFFIFLSHLATGVILKPKCLKVPILSPQHRMLHTGMSDYFEMTMHSYVLYSYINIYLDFIVSIVMRVSNRPLGLPQQRTGFLLEMYLRC